MFEHHINCVGIPLSYDNIYYRTCNTLESYLRKNGFQVSCVSRSSVGHKDFYNIDVTLPKSEFKHKSIGSMRKLLGIEGVGLVDFHKYNDRIHEVILIDEKELNDKYLKNGNLVFLNDDEDFKIILDMIDEVDTNELSVLVQLADIKSRIYKLMERENKDGL